MDSLKCEVCQHTAIGVCCSPLGPISHAYCLDCLKAGRQPYRSLVAVLGDITCRTDIFPEIWDAIIEPTLKYYNKTEQDLFKDIKDAKVSVRKKKSGRTKNKKSIKQKSI